MELLYTHDGSHTLRSVDFGATYHSHHGAITEANHVFIRAGLWHAALSSKQIRILEAGFGTGLNAFMTWLEAERQGLEISYTALETHPVSRDMVQALNYPDQLSAPARFSQFIQLHEAPWDQSIELNRHFTLEKRSVKIEFFSKLNAFDLIYYDAFAPAAQPELWTQAVMQNMFDSLAPGGSLVTYCAQGAFRRNLKAAGFMVTSLPGPPGKREMTRAVKAGATV